MAGCGGCEDEQALVIPPGAPALDYRDPALWVARGDRGDDPCDRSWPGYPDGQGDAAADTFYVHPTTFGLESLDLVGNGDPANARQRAKVDETVADQAPAFASASRIWAPRYRQASLRAFAADPADERARGALDAAYRDVLAAFDHYLAAHNAGRPIILAGHSQGSTWLVRLLRDRFEGEPLADRLVVAYLVGEFIGPDTFEGLPICAHETATGCVVSWATVASDGTPRSACGSASLSPECTSAPINTRQTASCTNPLTWTDQPAAPTNNAAAALGSGPFLDEFVPGGLSAWCEGGVLRVDDRVSVAGVGTLRENIGDDLDSGDYHPIDIELFFGNIRANVSARVAAR